MSYNDGIDAVVNCSIAMYSVLGICQIIALINKLFINPYMSWWDVIFPIMYVLVFFKYLIIGVMITLPIGCIIYVIIKICMAINKHY